ncbi:hypothetical protein [Magnetospirillum sp. UT-4]|uniref:hypothetical protein n=1 Tax=Magnetospirillum sp. UT-4 TaxID=2681467 RepID=UPI0013835D1B|nr:hypothetical protein [Magnetospirillum sp. UT-4]CAA7614185.1 conserved hypothetical protein [Magnetospirillum sp. UT-4]
MGSRGPKLLRRTTNHVLDAFKAAIGLARQGDPLPVPALTEIIAGLENSPQFDEFYRRAYDELVEIIENEKLESKRTNAFGRLIVHQIKPLLIDGTLDRAILPNIFSFLHLVLGDEAEIYGERCVELATATKAELDDDFTWEAFYRDEQAKLILWHTLVRIAESFKRWDLRKDWFIKLMQYTPTTVSLGQSSFVVREVDRSEEPRVFGNREFCAFFHAMFHGLTELAPADDALFRKEFGTDPHHHIGQFLVHLATCQV